MKRLPLPRPWNRRHARLSVIVLLLASGLHGVAAAQVPTLEPLRAPSVCPDCPPLPAPFTANLSFGPPVAVAGDLFEIPLLASTAEFISRTRMTIEYNSNCVEFFAARVGTDVDGAQPLSVADLAGATDPGLDRHLRLEVDGLYGSGCNTEVFVVTFRAVADSGAAPCRLVWDRSNPEAPAPNELENPGAELLIRIPDLTFCDTDSLDLRSTTFAVGTPLVLADAVEVPLRVSTPDTIAFTQMTLEYDSSCLSFAFATVGADVVGPGAMFVNDVPGANDPLLDRHVTVNFTGTFGPGIGLETARLHFTVPTGAAPPCRLGWDRSSPPGNPPNHLISNAPALIRPERIAFVDGSAGSPANPPANLRVLDPIARNDGPFTVRVLGDGLDPGTSAALLVGESVLDATDLSFPIPGRMDATFDLTGLFAGSADLRVTNAAGSATLDAALVVYADPSTLERVTTASGSEFAPAVARAGSRRGLLAYLSDADESILTFVQDLDSLEETATLLPGILGASVLAWGPLADRIAYVAGGELRIHHLDTGTDSSVTALDPGADVDWSPAGERVAMTPLLEPGRRAVAILDLPSGQVLDSTTPPAAFSDQHPSWSPDGVQVVFERRDLATGASTLMRWQPDSPASAAPVPLTPAGTTVYRDPAWSPDGRWIAFSADFQGALDLYVIDAARGESAGRLQVTRDVFDDRDPAWTEDGRRLVFHSLRSDDLFLASDLVILLDTDGDGVPDSLDACPDLAPAAGEIDRNLDGCPDPTSSFRSTRFWSPDQLPVHYRVAPSGDPRIGDGSDLAAVQAGFEAWSALPGSDQPFVADVLPGAEVTTAGDGINEVSFSDPEGFRTGFLAITRVTSVVTDTVIGGRWYHPGEIVDADVLFNAQQFSFSTDTFAGTAGAFDLQSTATHEIGHLWGLGHTSVQSSTLFYVVPPSAAARSLEADDTALATRTYAAAPPAPQLEGRVLRVDGSGVPGAAVLAIATAAGDTLRMTVTGADGGYRFFDLTVPYAVFALPLDGTGGSNGMVPGHVSDDLVALAQDDFVAEFWNGPGLESHTDADSAFVADPAQTYANADILLNADLVGPQVVRVVPADGALDVAATTAISVRFDESIDLQSISLSSLLLQSALGDSIAGTAAVVSAGSLLVFTPGAALEFGLGYTLRVGPGILDRFGNAMAAAVVSGFTVQPQPPVEVTSASPSAVPAGGILVLGGTGFSADTGDLQVTFDPGGAAVNALPFAATPEQVLVTVPATLPAGDLTVQVCVCTGADSTTSAPFPVTILPPKPAPTANPVCIGPVCDAALSGLPRKVAVRIAADFAYVATTTGLDIVDVDPASANFLTSTALPVSGGCTGVATSPDGLRAFVVGPEPPRLRALDTDPGSIDLHRFVETAGLAESPLGIAVVPGGREALVVFANRVALVEVRPGSGFGRELRDWRLSGTAFLGDIAVSSRGQEAWATTGEGQVGVLGLAAGEDIVTLLLGGTEPREMAGDPTSSSFLEVDASGNVRRFGIRGPLVQNLSLPGGYTGLTMSPEGDFAFAANFVRNCVQVLDLRGNNLLDGGFFTTGIDPRDLTADPTGRFVYVVTAASNRLEVYDTLLGPSLATVAPASGGPGTLVTLRGTGFDPLPANNVVTIDGVAHVPLEGDTRTLVVRQLNATPGLGATTVRTPADLQTNVVTHRTVQRTTPGRFEVAHRFASGQPFTQDLLMAPDGEFLYAFNFDGDLAVIRADPTDADLHRPVQTLQLIEKASPRRPVAATSSRGRLAATPDGRKLYVAGSLQLQVFDVDPRAAQPLRFARALADSFGGQNLVPTSVATTPAGDRLVFTSVEFLSLTEVDVARDSILAEIFLSPAPGPAVVHPRGPRAYVGTGTSGTPLVQVVDLDPTSEGYRGVLASIPVGIQARDAQLVLTPDGRRLLAFGRVAGGSAQSLVVIDTEIGSPTFHTVIASLNQSAQSHGVVQHGGRVLYVALPALSSGVVEALDPLLLPPPTDPTVLLDARLTGATSMALSLDDARLYVSGLTDSIAVVDLAEAAGLKTAGGSGQIGVVGTTLPDPVRVQLGGTPALVEGTPVLYEALVPGGGFGFPDGRAYGVLDAGGQASAVYAASPRIGVDTLHVQAAGEFETLTVTVVEDTSLAPPRLLEILPGTQQIPGVNTAVAMRFSKAIDPASLSSSTILLRDPAGGTIVPSVITTADAGRRVALKPLGPLAPASPYTFEATAGVRDFSGNALTNPGAFAFETLPQPPPHLRAVFPPAATVGDPVVLSGSGFGASPEANQVLFGQTTVVPLESDPGALTVQVPANAGDSVRVIVAGVASNARPFVLLPPEEPPVNQVIDEVDVPSSGQQIAIVPDGSRAYMTSAGANSVVPIRLGDQVAEASVAVGLHPFGVVASPSGDRVYVSNFFSNSVSVLDAVPTSTTFQEVIATIAVGKNPTGVAIHPDGRTLYTVNYGDSSLAIIDTDSSSATLYAARANTKSGCTSQTVDVTPDGGVVIVGTGVGLLYLDPLDGKEISRTETGFPTLDFAVTPDGAFVVVLTADNQLFLVDILPGSPTRFGARANTKSGCTSQTVDVAPDGGFAYVTDAEGQVFVFEILQQGGAGKAAVAPGLQAPFALALLDSFPVGENPHGMDFDPSGTGLLLVVNSGSQDVSFVDTRGTLQPPPSLHLIAVNDVAQTNGVDQLLRIVDPGTGVAELIGSLGSPFADTEALAVEPGTLRIFVVDDSLLLRLDPFTGTGTLVGNTGFADIDGIQFQPGTGILYGVTHGSNLLVRIDTATGQAAVVAANVVSGRRLEDLAFHPDGRAFVLTGGSPRVYQIDLATGAKLQRWVLTGATSLEALLWSPDGMTLYSAADRGLGKDLVTIDLTTSAIAYVDSLPSGFRDIEGLAWLPAQLSMALLGGTPTDVPPDGGEDVLPTRFALHPTRPNPFRNATAFFFDLPAPVRITMKVYAVDGSLVRTLATDRRFPAGRHVLRWSGHDRHGRRVGSGIYFLRMHAGPWSAKRKVVLLR